jgi:hypothetical protein
MPFRTASDQVVGNFRNSETLGYSRARKDADRRQANTPARLRAFNQGVTLGFADEFDAAGAALETGANNLIRRMTGRPSVGYGMADAYKADMDAQADADTRFAERHPVQSVALQVAGGVASPIGRVGGGFVARGANATSRIARGAAVGAMTGAAAGEGVGRGNAVKRLPSAGKGLMTGAAVGGAGTAALEAVGAGARVVNNMTGQRLMSPRASAAGRLRDALRADGVSDDVIAQAVSEYDQVGATSPTLADVAGENTRALLRFAGSQRGPARGAMQTYRDETVHGLPDAAMTRAEGLTPGETRPANAVAESLAEARDTAARTNYREPYATPVQIDAEMASALRGDTGRAAIRRARAAAAARRDDAQMQELDSLLTSNMEQFPQVSAGTLDRIRIAMGERARTAARRGAGDMASGLGSRARDIDTGLDNVPGLEVARGDYRSATRAIEGAQEIGPTVLRASPSEFAANLADMDERALNATRVGARQAITDALGQRANASGVLDQIAYAPNARQNLTALFGEAEADRFIQAARLNLQRARNANFMAPNTGSQTQLRGQDAVNLKSAFRFITRPVEAILERLANGLTITDAEAAELVRLGLMPANDAATAVRPTMTGAGRIGQGASRVVTATTVPAVGMVNSMTAPRQ